MIDTASISELGHRDVYDATGSRIGETSDVYLDDETGLPEWVTVKTGLFGTKETFVPLRDAELTTDGLRVRVGKDVVKDAPKIDPDGRLSPMEERELYRYYGLNRDSLDRDVVEPDVVERDVVERDVVERDATATGRAPRTVTEPAHPVDAVRVGTTDDVARDEDQVSGPLDPPEAQRNVAAPATEKPILRRYGER